MKENADFHSFVDNFRFVFSQIGRKRRGLTGNLVVYSLSKAMQVFFTAVTVQLILNILLQSTEGNRAVLTVLSLAVGIFLASAAEDFAWNRYWPEVVAVRFQFLSMLGHKAMMLDYPSTENVQQLKKLELARAASSNNRKGFAGLLLNLSKLSAATASCIMCVGIMARIAPIAILPIFICALVNNRILKQFKDLEFETNLTISQDVDQKKQVFDSVFWNFKYGKEIRIFGFSGILLNHFREILNRQELLFKRQQGAKLKNSILLKFSIFAFESVAYGFVLRQVTVGKVSTADFLTLVSVFASVLLYTEELLTILSDLRNNSREISCFRRFIDAPQQSEDSGRERIPAEFETLKFDHVTFRYPGANRDALRDVSFTIHRGERVALVGANGSGKSTILKLIMRLYTPTEGRILLNDRDIQSFSLLEYYALFSTMFQDSQVYAFPIAQNIAMSEEIDSERLQASLALSGFDQVAQRFPQKENTMLLKLIDDSGVELSGGEVQKLTFARAIYKNGPIALLDEPTAALDAFSEANMFAAISSFVSDRTSIVVTHKLSSVRSYSKILYLEYSELKEMGTHQELLTLGGRYAELFHRQADLYEKASQMDEGRCRV